MKARICGVSPKWRTWIPAKLHPGHDSVTADQIIATLLTNAETAKTVLRGALRRIPREPRACECATALLHSLVTPAELVPDAVKRELQPLIGKYMR